jgi:diketogulonate reductase-like aldo/keto reductase
MSTIDAIMLPLSDGADIPQIFSAAFRLGTVEATIAHIHSLYYAGVRHFEIAELFGNGHTICDALREVAQRNQVFISLKVWPKSQRPDDVVQKVEYLLGSYGLTHVDLLSIHAPIDVDNKVEQYKALETLKDMGLTRSLGLVNINAVMLQDLLKNCRITPVTYQLEASPFGQNEEMVEFCGDSSIVVLNTSSINKGLRGGNSSTPVGRGIAALAEAQGMSPTRLLLLWSFTRGMCVGLPAGNAAVTFELQQGVSACFNARLSAETMDELKTYEEALSTAWVPTEAVLEE